MRSVRLVAAFVVGASLLTGCATGRGAAASGGAVASSPTSVAVSGTPGVLPVVVSSEIGVGRNRVVLSLLDPTTNQPVASPDRKLSVTFSGPNGASAGPVEPEFIWAIEDQVGVYAAEAEFPVAGDWTAQFVTSAPGKAPETIPFGFQVKEDTSVLRPGEAAPSVDTPTAADVDGDLAELSTDDDPRPEFYETSVADALAAREPFVVAFATPKFCVTAMCGPAVDRLKPIAEKHPDVTFINVEPYQLEMRDGQLQPVLDASGQLKAVPAVEAFGLVSEPYVFVVDAKGTIRAGFEAVFGDDELERALGDLG